MLEQYISFGSNFHSTEGQYRSRTESHPQLHDKLLALTKCGKLRSLVSLNTCKRVEYYVQGDADWLKGWLGENGFLEPSEQSSFFFTNGRDAISHLFLVTAGLDSQVIGDHEILGQVKAAFLSAKGKGLLSGTLERLFNKSVEAAKEVRSTTHLSSGTVSLAYACKRYLSNTLEERALSILLVGTGDFGCSVAQYLAEGFDAGHIALMNRTASKAEQLAGRIGATAYPFESLTERINKANVVITALNVPHGPLIQCALSGLDVRDKLFIDMSMPHAVDRSLASQQTNTRIVGLDELAKEVNDTLQERLREVPKARRIIDKHMEEFIDWCYLKVQSKNIQSWRSFLLQKSMQCPHLAHLDQRGLSRVIEKDLVKFIDYLRAHAQAGQTYNPIHEFARKQNLLCEDGCANHPEGPLINKCSTCPI